MQTLRKSQNMANNFTKICKLEKVYYFINIINRKYLTIRLTSSHEQPKYLRQRRWLINYSDCLPLLQTLTRP